MSWYYISVSIKTTLYLIDSASPKHDTGKKTKWYPFSRLIPQIIAYFPRDQWNLRFKDNQKAVSDAREPH